MAHSAVLHQYVLVQFLLLELKAVLTCSTHLDITGVSLLSWSCKWTSAFVANPSTETTVSREMFKLFMEIVFILWSSFFWDLMQQWVSYRYCGSTCQSHQQGSSKSKKTYAQSNFYTCLWSLNGIKDPYRNISALKMIQAMGNCSLLKFQKVMKVHVLVARLLMTLHWKRINWTLSGTWLVRFFRKICGKAVPCNVTMSGSMWRCQINSRYWRQVLGCCSTRAKQNHCKLLPHINFHSWQRR